MADLSIIIKAKETEIPCFISLLKPLTDDIDSEIIIINHSKNEINDDDIRIEKYDGSYENYIEYVSSICSGKRLLLIESGYVLDCLAIELLRSALIDHKDCTLTAEFWLYVDKLKERYFIKERPIVYSVESKGIKKIDVQIEDESLIESSSDDFFWIFQRFVYENDYDKLALWYEEYILNGDEELKNSFYKALEKFKLGLQEDQVASIESEFMRKNIKNEYLEYLHVQQRLRKGDASYQKVLKSFPTKVKNTYVSYILHSAFVQKDFALEIMRTVEDSLLKSSIIYLLTNVEGFYKVFFDFIVSRDLSSATKIKNNENILVYKKLLLYYIEAMSSVSYNAEKRQILVMLFVNYVNCAVYLLRERLKKNKRIFLDAESRFIIEADKISDYVEKGDIASAEAILRRAALNYPVMGQAVEYYIYALKVEKEKWDFKVSICMMVKDEEKNLERCLKSLKPLVDSGLAELIIVDTGSTDGTVEIAKRYTDNVYFHPWRGDFSDARNYSISFARGEYIMIMDADEELEPGESEKLKEIFMEKDLKGYNTATVILINYTNVDLSMYVYLTQVRIFKNDGTFTYRGVVHNQPMYKGPIKNLDIKVRHYGYIMTDDIKTKKFLRTSTLLKKELSKNPDNLYYRYQLSKSYGANGDRAEALEQVEIYMDQIERQGGYDNKHLALYGNAIKVYYESGKYDRAIEVSNQVLIHFPDYIDILYYKALALLEKQNYSEAITTLHQYFKLREDFFSREIARDTRLNFYTVDLQENAIIALLLCHYYLQEHHKVLQIVEAIENHDTIKRILPIPIESYIELNDFEGLAYFYSNTISLVPKDLSEAFAFIISTAIAKKPIVEQKEAVDKLTRLLPVEITSLMQLGFEEGITSSTQIGHFLNNYNLDDLTAVTAEMINKPVRAFLEGCSLKRSTPLEILKQIKVCASFVLRRVMYYGHIQGYSDEELIKVLEKYIKSVLMLMELGEDGSLSQNEKEFASTMEQALAYFKVRDLPSALKHIKTAAEMYNEMAKPLALYVKYLTQNEDKSESLNEINEYARSIKQKLEELITQGFIYEAKLIIEEYESIIPDDTDLYSIKAIILLKEGKVDEAEQLLLRGMEVDPNNIDLLYNAGYLYQCQAKSDLALHYYKRAIENSNDQDFIDEVKSLIDAL